MLRWRSLGLLLCGLSSAAVAGCKDEPSGPGVSDDTRWRIACARETDRGACQLDQPPHGGPETAGDIEVSCTKSGAFLRIEIEDPGDSEGTTRRNRSIIRITQINLAKNQCSVTATEYDRSNGGAELEYIDVCEGNTDKDGMCTIEGKMNSDGYDFNGSIYCPAMRRGSGPRDFKLENGSEQDEPVPLKIVNCSG